MADNYLEKHYDDYQRRKAEWERKKRLGLTRKRPVAAKPPGSASGADSRDEK